MRLTLLAENLILKGCFFMGLFDKLCSVATKAIEATMMGEKEQKYYDIIFNLLICIPSLQKEHIKNFIKGKYNEECDETALCKALNKFETTTLKTNEVWYKLTSKQSSHADSKNGGASWYNKEEVKNICFADFKENIRSKFAKVFNTVQENPSKASLDSGIGEITRPLSYEPYNIADDRPNFRMAMEVISEELLQHFFLGNDLLCNIAADKVLSRLTYNYENKDSSYIRLLYAVALRALNYAKSDINEEYVSITEEDCAKAVYNSKHYNKNTGRELSYIKEIYGTEINRIFKETILYYSSTSCSDWINLAAKDNCFVDGACFHAWSKVAEHFGKSTDDVEEAVLTINRYIISSVN